MIALGFAIAQKAGLLGERFQRAIFSKSKRKHIFEEDQRQIARATHYVRGAGFFGEGPKRACAPIDGEESSDCLYSRFQVLAADEEHARDVSGCARRQGRIVDPALVDDESEYPLRFPGDKFVVELATRRHAPQQERRVAEFEVAGAGCEFIQRIEKSLSAALGDIRVIFEEALIVRLIREMAAHQRQFVLHGKCLSRGVIDHRPAIPIRTGHEHRHSSERSRIIGIPKPELGLGVIAARRTCPIERSAAGRGINGKRKGKRGDRQVGCFHHDIITGTRA